MYKITTTTDNKNIGVIINIDAPYFELSSGFIMRPSKITIIGDEAIISNSNYIINATKI